MLFVVCGPTITMNPVRFPALNLAMGDDDIGKYPQSIQENIPIVIQGLRQSLLDQSERYVQNALQGESPYLCETKSQGSGGEWSAWVSYPGWSQWNGLSNGSRGVSSVSTEP